MTIQAKILELIKDIQKKKQLSVIYITHDLGVVAKVADMPSQGNDNAPSHLIGRTPKGAEGPCPKGAVEGVSPAGQRISVAPPRFRGPSPGEAQDPEWLRAFRFQCRVAKVADCVNVMYAGRIIESGSVNDIFYDPRHPYTWGLLASLPDVDSNSDELYTIPGTPPNMIREIKGDAFAARNPFALKIDEKLAPPMFQVSDTHRVASWLASPYAPHVEMPQDLKERIEKNKREAKLV